MEVINFGTLNTRGNQTKEEKYNIGEDAMNYKLHILGITETHNIKEQQETIKIKRSDGKIQQYWYYNGGIEGENKYTGVGLIIDKSLKVLYIKRISDRICIAEIELSKEHKIIVINAYAPTLVVSEKNEEIRDQFYELLDQTYRKVNKSKNEVIVMGDFNAKTGSGFKEFPENIGRYGKGEINSSGRKLLEFARKNNLILTNTVFNHKLAHRTTWISPERINPHNHHDGTLRRNPYRNQIDYILTKIKSKNLVKNSRSYSGITTYTDHKLVKMCMSMKWWKIKQNKNNCERINVQQFRNEQITQKFKEKVSDQLKENIEGNETPNEIWGKVSEISIKIAKEVLGSKRKAEEKYIDEEIESLSKKQKRIRDDIEASRNKAKRRKLRNERNRIMNKIKSKIKIIKDEEYEKELEQIERCTNEHSRCYEAARMLQRKKPKKDLVVFNKKEEILSSDREKVNEITEHFKIIFQKEGVTEKPEFKPEANIHSFQPEEIRKAANKLKNNKSAGPDDVYPELIKNAPEEVFENIAKIINQIIETENTVDIIKKGILIPLPKPGKKKGPVKHLRPVILLSVLRKIIAISLITRCWDRLSKEITPDQAAYQPGRSTTEQVFTLKLLTEKAIISENYEIIILLIDMSKAFDTVNRSKLLNILKEILNNNEMRLMDILISDVKLQVRVGAELGKEITTNIGVAQGDCLSAVLFILYLSKAIKPMPLPIEEDYSDRNLWSALDWMIPKDKLNINIDLKYADDLTFVRSEKAKINTVKREIAQQLEEADLTENTDKREEIIVSRESSPVWKKCKYLGTLLETEADINRRKGLALDSYKTLDKIFKSRTTSEKTKIKVFEAYISSIFLYNSELWTLTKNLENKIDSFQRKLLRNVLGFHYPKIIKNEDLYKKTKVIAWSNSIRKRRLSWLGHLFRLKEETPARKALNLFCIKAKRPAGRPKETWLNIVLKDIAENSDITFINTNNQNLFLEELINLSQNRNKWNCMIKHMMLG